MTNETQNFLVHVMLTGYCMEFYEISVKLFKNRIMNFCIVVLFSKCIFKLFDQAIMID